MDGTPIRIRYWKVPLTYRVLTTGLSVLVLLAAACSDPSTVGNTSTSVSSSLPSTTLSPAENGTSSTSATTTTSLPAAAADEPRVEHIIEVGDLPRGLAFFDESVWVANARSSSLSRIDVGANTQMTQIATGATPVTLTVLDDSLWVSVIGDEQGDISQNAFQRVDPGTNQVVDSWPVPIFHNTAAGGGLLWAFDSVTLLQAVDPGSGEIVGTVEVGRSVQSISADETSVWGVNTSGGVWWIDIGQMDILGEVDLEDLIPGRSRITVTPKGAAVAYEGVLAFIDRSAESFEIVEVPGLRNVNDLIFSEGALWLSGTVGTGGVLLEIDAETGEVVDTYRVGPEPAGIAFGAGSIWVGDQVEDVVIRLANE